MFFVLVVFTLYVFAIVLTKGLNLHISHSYNSDLESFISSRNPQNVAEVERLTQEYHSGINWMRGL